MKNNNDIGILILDDEESIRDSLQGFLEDFDYNVYTADTSKKALDIIKNNNCQIAIVDMRLPGMDGNAFILKANQINSDTGFIIHTGSANFKLSKEVSQLGIKRENIFFKPVTDMMDFIKAIDSMVED